ncbi:MAG: hypothetical protein H6816_15780 [Phycisphaerales bacterium]|nr:hypothetical protein [Phycisphaerales bacterium]
MARAQSAYFMLVRGGIAKSRFPRWRAFADLVRASPTTPKRAANRRIEILLEGS